MNPEEFLGAFGSALKARIPTILASGNLTLSEVVAEYRRRYDKTVYRETVYRALESLSKAGIIDKNYDKSVKRIKYKLNHGAFVVDFVANRLEPAADAAAET
jgi:Fe2+ or Zn2+ uptake regulation protein